MRAPLSFARALGVVATLVVSFGATAHAQELEPGAYAVAPVGVNVLVATNTFSAGDLSFDPAAPIDEASAAINVTGVGYARTFNLAGRSAQIAGAMPIITGHVEGRYLGEFAEVTRFGIGDPRVRLGVNLHGARAMDLKTFAAFRPRRIVGASVTVSLPLGQYSSERLINLGNGRWAVKPEVALVHYLGRWTIEAFAGAWIFERNEEFYKGSVRTQDPIASLQFHVDYAVSPRLFVSGNANFYSGGRTTVNDRQNFDLQRNSRLGLTLSHPLGGGRQVRVAVSQGAYTTIGGDFTSVSFAFQQTWVPRVK
jgi:hypothetical protein